MKKILLSACTLLIIACSSNSNSLEHQSDVQLKDGALALQKKFDTEFAGSSNVDTMKFILDSMDTYFKTLHEKYPDSEFSATVLFGLGESAMKLKEGKMAIDYFDQLIAQYADNEIVPRAAYFRAYTYQEVLHENEQAIEAYKKLYKTYPDSKWAENAKNQVLFLNNPSFIGE